VINILLFAFLSASNCRFFHPLIWANALFQSRNNIFFIKLDGWERERERERENGGRHKLVPVMFYNESRSKSNKNKVCNPLREGSESDERERERVVIVVLVWSLFSPSHIVWEVTNGCCDSAETYPHNCLNIESRTLSYNARIYTALREEKIAASEQNGGDLPTKTVIRGFTSNFVNTELTHAR